MRVLHAPAAVAGNAWRIAQAERELGLDSRCITVDPNTFGYPVDEQLRTPAEGFLLFELQRWRLLMRALLQFDVIHFNFGRTFFPFRLPLWTTRPLGLKSPLRFIYRAYSAMLEFADLALLKRSGKAVFMTFQGDDARQGDFCRANFDVTWAKRLPFDYYDPEDDKAKRRRIAIIDRYVDGMYSVNPDLLYVLPERARFIPYASVDLRMWMPKQRPDARTLRVLHAPTHRILKGTDVILDAVDRLKRAGERFEFVMVENVKHKDARELYESADLAVDQLFGGWYGGFAVEMMALGVPVICHMRPEDLRFLPAEMRSEMPIIATHPATFCDVLRKWIRAPRSEVRQIGARSRAYVERWHDPVKIAAGLRRDYERALGRPSAT